MKKVSLLLAILLVSLLAVGATAMAEVKIGQAIYPAHGTRAFCVATVAMDGDVIVTARIEEFQFLDPASFTGVPNPESFTNENGNVLAPKRLNSDAYSANMSANGGATQDLITSYIVIEEYVAGKTVAELQAAIEGKTAEEVLADADIATSSTLVDTLGYIQAIIEAANSVQ